MSLKDKSAPSKRNYYANAIKQLQAEMENEPKWDHFLVEEKCKKLQSDYEKFENKNLSIYADENADAQMKRECELQRVEIEALYFKLKPQLNRWISMHESKQKEKKKVNTIEHNRRIRKMKLSMISIR